MITKPVNSNTMPSLFIGGFKWLAPKFFFLWSTKTMILDSINAFKWFFFMQLVFWLLGLIRD